MDNLYLWSMFEINDLPEPPFPILGHSVFKESTAILDLSVTGETLRNVDLADQDQLHAAIWAAIHKQGANVGMGGYLEHRGIYKASPHFESTEEDRCIHLGIDLWAEAGQPVFAPVDGMVHSLAMNSKPLDYGATIILEHRLEKRVFWTLYGHLSATDLIWNPGEFVSAGTPFCHMGNRHENGGWVPHLHFQVITDIGDFQGDFPGVASIGDKDIWAARCPNPAQLIQFIC